MQANANVMETAKPPKRKRIWIVAGIVAAVVAIVGINVAVTKSKATGSAASLEFAAAEERTLSSNKLISGSVVPGDSEMLYVDPTKGKVKDIFVQEGQEIKSGDKLFSYENTDLDVQIKQIELQAKMNTTRYNQTKESIASLKKSVQKAKDDVKEGPAAPALEETVKTLEQQLTELEYQLETMKIEMEQTALQKEQLIQQKNALTVYSPMDGVIKTLDKSATNSSAAASQQVFIQIASVEPYHIEGTLSELQKAQIQKDQAVTISAKAVADKTWNGKITEVSDYPEGAAAASQLAGQQSQTISYYAYEASLESQDGLSPGYHVTLEVELSSEKILAVPQSSVVTEGEESYVYLVKDGILAKQMVVTGKSDGEWVEVTAGVEAGQQVVTNPSDDVRTGMEVAVND